MRSLTLVLSLVLTAVGTGAAESTLKGEAGAEDTIPKLQHQIAALEMRIRQLELGQAAINSKINKVDLPDTAEDDPGSGAKKPANNGKGTGAPDKGPDGGGASAGAKSGGGATDGVGPLQNMPGKPSNGSGGSGGNANRTGNNRVTAPFIVVDTAGKVIFRVQDPSAAGGEGGGDRGIYVFNEQGQSTAQLVSLHGGGKLKVQKPATDNYVAVAANDDATGTIVRVNGKQRAFMGAASNDGGVVAVFGGDGQHAAAGLQLSQGGGGLVAVFKNDTPISFLTESTSHPGGGNVTATNPAGDGVFSAGYDGAQGAACVGHKGALHCLGIGLPMTGDN